MIPILRVKSAGDEISLRLNIVTNQLAEEARTGMGSPTQLWHEESQVMVRLDSGRMFYGYVSGQLTNEISKGELIQYLMSKNLQWDTDIFNMIDWKGVGSTLGKTKDT